MSHIYLDRPQWLRGPRGRKPRLPGLVSHVSVERVRLERPRVAAGPSLASPPRGGARPATLRPSRPLSPPRLLPRVGPRRLAPVVIVVLGIPLEPWGGRKQEEVLGTVQAGPNSLLTLLSPLMPKRYILFLYIIHSFCETNLTSR